MNDDESDVQVVDGRPSGPMGVEEEGPTFMIQIVDGRPSTPVLYGPAFM